MNNIVLSGNSISFTCRTDLKYLHDINVSDYIICLFVCMLFNFCGYYCIYVYIEGLMED